MNNNSYHGEPEMIQSREALASSEEEGMPAPVWVYESSHYRPRWHYLVFRDDRLGVQMQIATRWRGGRLGKRHKTTYYRDGEDQVFRSEAKLIRALPVQEKRISGSSRGISPSPLRRMIFSFSQMMGLW